jgi:protein-disulfide isomerase-like protein with CxxC motif
MDETIWCYGINLRVKKSEAVNINGRFVYGGVFCDTGQPFKGEVVELFQAHNKLGSLNSSQLKEINQQIDQFLNESEDSP